MTVPVRVISTPNMNGFQERHRRMLSKLANNEVAFKKISILLDRWVQKNFKSEGGNVGGWKSFKYGGRVKGSEIDFTAKLLQDTGNLRASFKSFHETNNAGIGSDVPYSIFHEKGISGSSKLPARRMLPNHKEVYDEANKILVSHVKNSGKELTKKGPGE